MVINPILNLFHLPQSKLSMSIFLSERMWREYYIDERYSLGRAYKTWLVLTLQVGFVWQSFAQISNSKMVRWDNLILRPGGARFVGFCHMKLFPPHQSPPSKVIRTLAILPFSKFKIIAENNKPSPSYSKQGRWRMDRTQTQ